MDKAKMEEVFDAMRAKVEALGYDCVGFEFAGEGGEETLRVYADMPGGIDLNDCQTISEALNEYLDSVAESLPDGYMLEVSSPGLERPLFRPDDYRRFTEQEAAVALKTGKNARGLIKAVSEDGSELTLLCEDGERVFKFSAIKRGNLVYHEEKGQKKTFKKQPKKKKQH